MKKTRLKKEKSSKSSRVGIKWKMFGILAVFIVVALFVIWLFQVKLVNYFYLETKFSEFEDSIDKIEEALGEDDNALNETVFNCSLEYYSAIYVFKVEGDEAKVLVKSKGPVDNLMPLISDRDLSELCELAYENGGSYMATVSFERGFGLHKSEIFGGGKEDAVKAAMEKAKKGPVGAVYLRIVEKDSVEYIIFQNSDLTPIQSTVYTLQRQFLWIGIVLLLLALVLAAIMSKVITKPIIKINNAAKKLSRGSYDEELVIKGYREIGELSDTLSFAAQEISKSDRFQKELLSNVSHDLRTPLTMIKGYGEVMRDIPGENTPENIQVIIDESARLGELVNDMLDISRIRAGAREPQMMSFCITDTVREVLLRYTKLIDRDGYKIEFVANDNVYVTADSIMMLQVLYNLINNAINYTGEDKKVTVVQQIIGSEVKISIIDTGEGIAPEELPFIWDRYYKVDKVHKRAPVGTGLGLAIVKGILELHGAAYGVESTMGKGSVFWFSMKRDDDKDSLIGE